MTLEENIVSELRYAVRSSLKNFPDLFKYKINLELFLYGSKEDKTKSIILEYDKNLNDALYELKSIINHLSSSSDRYCCKIRLENIHKQLALRVKE